MSGVRTRAYNSEIRRSALPTVVVFGDDEAVEQAIELTVTLLPPIGRLRAVLTDEPGLLVTDSASREETRRRQFHGTVSLDIGGGSKIQHDVTVTVGMPQATESGIRVPVRWEPAGGQRLLPSFAGEFEFACGRPGTLLTLRGSYSVPLGAVGRFGEGLAGRRVAQRVLHAYAEATAKRLEEAVARHVTTAQPHTTSPMRSTPTEIGSEDCIG